MNKNFKSHEMTIECMADCHCDAICKCSCTCGMDPFIVNDQYKDNHTTPYWGVYNGYYSTVDLRNNA